MRFAAKVLAALLLLSVAAQLPLPAQPPEEEDPGAVPGGQVGPGLDPYTGVHVREARWGVAAPFGSVSSSTQSRVTYGPLGGYHAATIKKVTTVGPDGGTSSVEAHRMAFRSAGIHYAGTAYYREVSAAGRSYTVIDRTGLTGDPYGFVHAHEAPAEEAAPFGAVAASSQSHVMDGNVTGVRAHSTVRFASTSPAEGSYTHVEHESVMAGPYGAVHAHEVHTASGPLGAAASFRSSKVAVVRASGTRVVAVGHSTRYISPSKLRMQAADIRAAYTPDAFTDDWFRRHASAWRPARWRVDSISVAPPWEVVARFCAVRPSPVEYDYGRTAVIDSGIVYLDGLKIATAAAYADRALAIADKGRQAQLAEEEEWQPLGIFGLFRSEEGEPQAVLQLAVNKHGILRGNYYDPLADVNLRIYGAVDRTTQRAAWSTGDKKTVVMEAGLRNLTEGETTALLHYGITRTRQVVLVRLEELLEEPH
jgi:hypothetical protein